MLDLNKVEQLMYELMMADACQDKPGFAFAAELKRKLNLERKQLKEDIIHILQSLFSRLSYEPPPLKERSEGATCLLKERIKKVSDAIDVLKSQL